MSVYQFLTNDLRNKILTIDDTEWCSTIRDYETNWDGTATDKPIYCDGDILTLKNGDKICFKCCGVRIFVFQYIIRIYLKNPKSEKKEASKLSIKESKEWLINKL